MRDNMPTELRQLIAQCEANVAYFNNNEMSTALHYAETTLLELERLKEAVYPGLPPFVSTPEKPQEDFYILVAEGLRAIFESHREPEGESNEQVQNSNSEPATQDAGKAD